MKTSTAAQPLTWRVLARLLCYPDAAWREALPALAAQLRAEPALAARRRSALLELVEELAAADPYEVEAAYVELFDRGRATALHLFEHVHGESRDRGMAMVDLRATYAQAGLELQAHELPDYLPVVLEFLSTQPPEVVRGFVAEIGHILNALHAALVQRKSRYAEVVAAALELGGQEVAAVSARATYADEPMDAAWEEPEAFGGCSSRGQSRPEQAQPVHIVRRAPQGGTTSTSFVSGS